MIHVYSAREEPSNIQIVGLSITIEKEIVALKLGEFRLQNGNNELECLSEHCNRPFAMIMLRIERAMLSRIRIFHKIEIN